MGARAAGMPWPNLACPVAMVECEAGSEQTSATVTSASLAHSSYANLEEAKLAVRCARRFLKRSAASCITARASGPQRALQALRARGAAVATGGWRSQRMSSTLCAADLHCKGLFAHMWDGARQGSASLHVPDLDSGRRGTAWRQRCNRGCLRQPASALLCIGASVSLYLTRFIRARLACASAASCDLRGALMRAARGRALVALQEGGDVESAAILTPYTGQVRVIGNMLRQQKLDAQVCT